MQGRSKKNPIFITKFDRTEKNGGFIVSTLGEAKIVWIIVLM